MKKQKIIEEVQEIIEPEIGEITTHGGIKILCNEFKPADSSEHHCTNCCFNPFPMNLFCDKILCYADERKDKTPVNFEEI